MFFFWFVAGIGKVAYFCRGCFSFFFWTEGMIREVFVKRPPENFVTFVDLVAVRIF